MRTLFIDYSSAFNTIITSKLITGSEQLPLRLDPGLPDGLPQVLRVGNNTSATLILNMGALQGCVLCPLLYSLFTHNCVAAHDSNTIIKFSEDTTVVGLFPLRRLKRFGMGPSDPQKVLQLHH